MYHIRYFCQLPSSIVQGIVKPAPFYIVRANLTGMKGADIMRTVASFDEMRSLVGQEIGVSAWIDVGQDKIDLFAEATGDFQWIHVDVERAKAEMPGGKTIAHGYFTLSLVPQLVYTIYQIDGVAHGLNYGSNRVRFTAPVPSGSRARWTWPMEAAAIGLASKAERRDFQSAPHSRASTSPSCLGGMR